MSDWAFSSNEGIEGVAGAGWTEEGFVGFEAACFFVFVRPIVKVKKVEKSHDRDFTKNSDQLFEFSQAIPVYIYALCAIRQ